MSDAPRTLSLQDLPVQRWRNGGGATREIARHPCDAGAPLLWRLSLADIDQAGPFSSFAGMRRTLVLLEGGGLTLHIAGRGGVLLHARGDACTFDGGDVVSARPHAGPCRVLNLMTAHGAAWTGTAYASGARIVAEFSDGHAVRRYLVDEPGITVERVPPAGPVGKANRPD